MPSPLLALHAALERLDLGALRDVGALVLDLDPLEPSFRSGAAEAARLLVARAGERHAIPALCDALGARLGGLPEELTALLEQQATAELELGDELGPYLIVRRLGRGRLGTTYLARAEGVDVRLKVLSPAASRDATAVQRYLTLSRMVGAIDHPGLPGPIATGVVDGVPYVAHPHVEGQTLAARIARTSAMHVEEARPVLRSILDALAALHAGRLVHGALRTENVLLRTSADGTDSVVLLDAGAHLLDVGRGATRELLGRLGSARSLSPEQIHGESPDRGSDLYSFGAIAYEVLSGQPPFPGATLAESLLGHVARPPRPLAEVAPPGWVGPALAELVQGLLSKRSSERPSEARSVLGALESVGADDFADVESVDDEELEERARALLSNPKDTFAEEELVAAIREGGSPRRVAESLRLAADLLDPEESPADRRAHLRLLARAARLYATTLRDDEAAEALYARLAELDPDDAEAAATLDRLRRRLGKYEDIVESLLSRCEALPPSPEKGALWAQIGRLYFAELDDAEQALVAFTQAFCEHPLEPGYAAEIERLAARVPDGWTEILGTCVEAGSVPRPEAAAHALYLQLGRWYESKVGRPDLALPCYAAILAADPTHSAALDGVTALYRRAQQWSELAATLLLRADAPTTPPETARDLRVEAAELLAGKLGAPARARELLERVLTEDPEHRGASEALVGILDGAMDHAGMLAALDARAAVEVGPARIDALFRAAEVAELSLKDSATAIARYEAVVAADPRHMDALRGLDRCLSQESRHRDLVRVLELQIAAAATPRQKVQLWERVAGIWDEEFLDHAQAAQAWENVLDLDPEHDTALTCLARHYRALERWNDVVLVTERHLELLSSDPARRVEKGLALARVLAEGLGLPDRALAVYESILALSPGHPEALDAVARLRASVGETLLAVKALEQLARSAATPAERAAHFLRAAQLLDSQGEPDAAIERFRLAADASPDDPSLGRIFRAALIARGDHASAARLLEQEIKQTEGEGARARLAGELAALCHDRMGATARAESWARVALEVDPTNLDALRVLADGAHAAGRHVEAVRHYDQVAPRLDAVPAAAASGVLARYAASLVSTGAFDRASEVAERLASSAGDDVEALERASEILAEHGAPARARAVAERLLDVLGPAGSREARARALLRLGEASRRTGALEDAEEVLEEAAELGVEPLGTLAALARVYVERGRYDQAIATHYRRLEHERGEGRVTLLVEIGDLAAEKLKDPSYAAKSYLAALSEQPSDRRVLGKLMQLYSAEKDWERLVSVVIKLADFVDDDRQKAKYLHTAGRIAWKELGAPTRGAQLLGRALALDPDAEPIARDAVEVHALAGDAEGLKEALKRQVKIASDSGDKEQMLRSLGALSELYLRHFGRLDQAIAVTEAALEVDPTDVPRREALAALYASDPGRYLDRALLAQHEILARDPFRPEAHRTLRKLYTDGHNPDAAWCACQALVVLGQAEPEEARFFQRMRSDEGITAKASLDEPDFHRMLVHPAAEPLVTALFTVIQPAVMAARVKTLKQLGLGPDKLVDPGRADLASAQVLPYAAEILGMPCPPLFHDPDDYGELSFVHAQHPSVVIGTAIAGVALPIQTLAFVSARHLTFYRQGLYVRQLVPTVTGLKAWLFAAIRLMVPAFPVPPDLAGPVGEAVGAIDRIVTGPVRDHLAQVVSRLIQDGTALDLRRWVAGVDLTADRAGLLVADDLSTAVEVIRAADAASSSVPAEERIEELFRFSVGEGYLAARRAIGIAIGS